MIDDSITIDSIVKEDKLYYCFSYTQLRAMYGLKTLLRVDSMSSIDGLTLLARMEPSKNSKL